MTTVVAQWLRETRLRQVNPDTGRPWSQEFLVDRIRAETGWKLYRPNYNGYEKGKTNPEPDTLARLVAFWAARDEPGPETVVVAEPPPDPLVAALDRQSAAIEGLVRELQAARLDRERLDELDALVRSLAEQLQAGQDSGAPGGLGSPLGTTG